MAEKTNAIAIEGLAHLVLGVSDLETAQRFYTDVLGFSASADKASDEAGPAIALGAANGATLVLVQHDGLADLSATGVHHAFSVTASQREAIASRLTAAGTQIHSYKEDNPPEECDPFYTTDPDGNRIQLVVSSSARDGCAPGLDHGAIQVANLIAAEWFYCDVLGFPISHRVGWRTADYIRAQAWARGEEDMAPGTRRLDKRYTVMVNKKVVARVNMQLFVATGPAFLGIYLANQHFQESPEENPKGSPRIGYSVPRSTIDEVCRRLDAADVLHSGPVTNSNRAAPSTSLYVRDPGGNFLEFIATA